MAMAETALALARRHADAGSRCVDEQTARIAGMDPQGEQIGHAEALLETMKATLALFVADLARLEASARASHATPAIGGRRAAPSDCRFALPLSSFLAKHAELASEGDERHSG